MEEGGSVKQNSSLKYGFYFSRFDFFKIFSDVFYELPHMEILMMNLEKLKDLFKLKFVSCLQYFDSGG